MNDLKRMQEFYKNKNKSEWLGFNCYPFFLSCKQKYIVNKILSKRDMSDTTLLDIGAGEGNFILHLLSLGVKPINITAVEYLNNRYEILNEKIPNIKSLNDDFLAINTSDKYDVIFLMAVLTSITDNKIRYAILDKALKSLSKDGSLVLYDYFDNKEPYLNDNYRAISLKETLKISATYKVEMYKKVYLKAKYAKGLCKIKLSILIPVFESLKIFNDNYHFIVITNEK